jgi:hypothetical protein
MARLTPMATFPNRCVRRYFKDQPLDHPAVTTDHLVHWYFEHELKLKYAEYVQILEVCSLKGLLWPVHVLFCYVRGQMTWRFSFGFLLMQVNSKDTVASQRQQMIKHIYDLLNAKPEQERTLLSLIINKFVRSFAPQVLVSLCSEIDSLSLSPLVPLVRAHRVTSRKRSPVASCTS